MTWSHRERLLAALNHEEPDRVPIDFGGTLASTIILDPYEDLKRHLGMTHETGVMSQTSKLASPHDEMLRRFGVDTRGVRLGDYEGGHAKVLDETSYVDEFGVLWKISPGMKDVHYLHKDGPFHDPKTSIDQIESFDWPDPDNPSLVKGLREKAEAIRQSGDYGLILVLPGGVIHRGYAMRGFERYLKDLYRKPEFAMRLMDKLVDYWVRTSENAIRAIGPENIDVAFFGEDLGTQDGCMFDPELYARMIKPRHRRMVETINSHCDAKVLYHCCGSAYHFIDHLIDIGVDALNPVQVTAKDMEPAHLKERFGDRIAFWGGINTQRILPFGTPDEVAAETRRVIDILGRGGGYVLNSVHNIQPGVPPENIVAMFDEAQGHRYDKAA